MRHVALDLDDVILDFCGMLVTAVNTEYDAGLSVDDINEWDLRKILDPIVEENWWNWWKRRDWLWAQAVAVPGAIGGIEWLRREGYYVEIVTSKPRWAEAQTWRWLGKWRPPVNRVTILDTEDKEARKSGVTEAEVLVDDKPENCQDFLDAGRRAILFQRPHNRSYRVISDPSSFAVAVDWREVRGVLEEWAA